MTEGETLPNGDPRSYDVIYQGRLFDFSRLKGETTLIKMYTGYKVEGNDKRAAYEIAVGEGSFKKKGIIYITHNFDYRGFTYYNDKEGYSILIVLYDSLGRELYGAYVPLQSLRQKDESFLYATGTKDGPGNLSFPQPPAKPLFAMQTIYVPSRLKERAGEVFFRIWQHNKIIKEGEKPLADGKAAIGTMFDIGEHLLSVKEVRYWVGMMVRYEPGKPIVLASLWVGLGGMIITFIGRMRKKNQPSAVSRQ
ncbi:MAG: hypothetical protein HZB62_12640 [Nitrospirae bacterium]|nr:hypothetical protein [Nitrospirota bacterium]